MLRPPPRDVIPRTRGCESTKRRARWRGYGIGNSWAEARSPQVRMMAFPAQPPDLRRLSLVVRASRFAARSPCSAMPPIRFLFVNSRIRSPLLSAVRSRSQPCGSLGSLRPTPRGTHTPKSPFMLGTQTKRPVFSRAARWSLGSGATQLRVHPRRRPVTRVVRYT